MRALLRDGFGKDLLAFLLVAILAGGAISGGIAWVAHLGLDRAITSLVGDYGQYDAIVQVHQENVDAAQPVLRNIVAHQLPGAALRRGVSLGGQTNFLLAVPDSLKTPKVLSALSSMFNSVPGYMGTSLIIEPSVVVQGLLPGVDATLIPEIEKVAGVRFVFRSGSDLIALLRSSDDVQSASAAIKQRVQSLQVVELRTPLGQKITDPAGAAARIAAVAGKESGLHSITAESRGMDTTSFVEMLREMRRFLISYATTVKLPSTGPNPLLAGDRAVFQGAATSSIVPGQKGPADAAVVQIWSTDRGTASGIVTGGSSGKAPAEVGAGGWPVKAWRLLPDGTVGEPVGTATVHNLRVQLDNTLARGETLLKQLDSLNRQTGTASMHVAQTVAALQKVMQKLQGFGGRLGLGTSGSAEQEAIFSVLLSAMLHQGATQQGPLAPLKGVDLAGLQRQLADVESRVHAIDALDIPGMIGEIEQVRRSLPVFTDAQIADSINMIDQYLAGQVIPGDRLDFVAPTDFDVQAHLPQFREILHDPQVSALTMAPGVVAPDARSTVFGVLGHVRELVAGLCAAMLTLLTLAFDWAAVVAYIRRRRSRRRFVTWAGPSAAVGACMLLGMAGIAGGVPTLSVAGAAVLMGMVLGIGVGWLAERINPINRDEVLAGEALGLGEEQVMRQIVIPGARPGVLGVLNRFRQWFP